MDDFRRETARIEERVRRHWAEDGLNEIRGGVLGLLVGAYIMVQGWPPSWTTTRVLFAVGFPVLILGLGFLSQRWVRDAKDRYVHPRTGYVALRGNQRLSMMLGGIMGVASILGEVLVNHGLVARVAVIGVVVGGVFFYSGRRVGLVRAQVEGLLCAVVGVSLSLLHLGESRAIALLCGWVGLSLAIGGAFAFRAHLRHAPPRKAA
jgi:hypothetical protein